jgi:hypothetical protein
MEDKCSDPVLMICQKCKPICTITKEEIMGMKEAMKRNRYTQWRIAIAGKYNLSRINFTVDSMGGIKYDT